MKTIYCNECFKELETVEYDIGIYINHCSCSILSIDEHENEVSESHEEGYEIGYKDGANDKEYELGLADAKE